MFTHAQSTLAALDMELAGSEGYALRPSDLTALYDLIPTGLYDSIWAPPPPLKPSKAKSTKSKPNAKSKVKAQEKVDMTLSEDFLELADVNEAHLTQQIKAYKSSTDALRGKSSTRRPLRTFSSIALRAAALSICKWPANNSNLTRDLTFFCKIGVIEYYMVEHVRYRQALMPTALGAVRNDLHRILDSCVDEYEVDFVESSGAIASKTVKTWVFLDGLETPANAKAPPLNQKAFLLASKQAEDTRKMVAFLKSMRVKVYGHETPWIDDDDGRAIDEDIQHSLDSLILNIWRKHHRDQHREREGVNSWYNIMDTPRLEGVFLNGVTYKDQYTHYNVSNLTLHLLFNIP